MANKRSKAAKKEKGKSNKKLLADRKKALASGRSYTPTKAQAEARKKGNVPVHIQRKRALSDATAQARKAAGPTK